MTGLLPMFLKLEGRRCLVVGAGAVAEPKIESLLRTGAEMLVVAPRATETIVRWAEEKMLTWERRNFQSADLKRRFLVIAASSPEVNDRVFRQARRKSVLCNVVDDPQRCDFFYPAIIRRGQLQIAVSTGGLSPALAQRIRQDLERQFGPEYEAWLEQIGRRRRELLAAPMDATRRRLILHSLASRDSFQDFLRRTSPRSRVG